jgi:hypothetical protein
MWVTFSVEWPQNKAKLIDSMWKSFKKEHPGPKLTYKTLIRYAQQQGWEIPKELKLRSTARPLYTKLSDIPEEDTTWYCLNRLAAGEHTTLVGALGLGKSQLALRYATAFTVAGEFPWSEGRAPLGSVILLLSEDSISKTVKRRMRLMGADMGRVYILETVKDAKGEHPFSLEGDIDALEIMLEEIGDVKLVVIDAISDYLTKPGSRTVLNSPEVRQVLRNAKPVFDKHGTALLSINHLNKPKETKQSASDRAMGNRGLTGHPRVVLFVGVNDDAVLETDASNGIMRGVLIPDKNNLGPKAPGRSYRIERVDVTRERPNGDPQFVWEIGVINKTSDELFTTEGKRGRKAMECGDWLYELLRHGPRKSNDIFAEGEKAGFNSKRIYNAAHKLRVQFDRAGKERKKSWWSLPEDPF